MKKNNKTPFFIKLKNAIFNFDKYQSFAEERIKDSIKYVLKIVAIFTIVISIMVLIDFMQIVNRGKEILNNEIPEFKFEENNLIIESEQKEFIKGDGEGYFSIIISSEKEDINEIENTGYQTSIAFLKNKLTIIDSRGMQSNYLYENINQKYDITQLNKQFVGKLLDNKVIYLIVFAIAFVYFYIKYFISILMDVLLLSIIGFLISRIINVRFKYKVILKMSIYALTLSIILNLVYIAINAFTGFTIKYFDIAYNLIAYIYLITAMLMIKSDLIKQQIELDKVIEEQRKISKEVKEENKEEENKENNKNEDDKEKKKEEDKDDGTPSPAEN